MFLYAPNRYRESIKAGESYKILVDSVEQRKAFRVETIRGWPVLTLRHSALESAGLPPDAFSREKRGAVELELRNLSGSEERAKKVFASIQFNRQNEVVHLHVGKLEAKHGDLFELLDAREHTQQKFISDFNSHRPEGLNATLGFEDNKLGLEVDDRHFAFLESHLRPYNLEACLAARFQDGKRQFRFWFDGERSRAEYDGTGMIKRFVATDDRLKFHVPKEREVTAVRKTLRPEIDSFMTARIMDELRLLSKTEGEEQNYAFEANHAISRHVNSVLSSVESRTERIAAKGKIAEEVNPAILSLAGWAEIRRHRGGDREERGGSTDPGPDSLMRSPLGELRFVEHKWYTDQELAFREAKRQLEGYKDYDIGPETRDVKGAFAAVLDWNPSNARGRLRVRRAWSRE